MSSNLEIGHPEAFLSLKIWVIEKPLTQQSISVMETPVTLAIVTDIVSNRLLVLTVLTLSL